MIALDTSSLSAYLAGERGRDVDQVDTSLEQQQAVLPPVVLSEILSLPGLPKAASALFVQLPLIPLESGFWERAGLLRAKILSLGFKARLADALIAQSCIDHDIPLVSRDADFRHFVRLGRLRLFH